MRGLDKDPDPVAERPDRGSSDEARAGHGQPEERIGNMRGVDDDDPTRVTPEPVADDDTARDVADPSADAETRLLGSERLACAEKVLARCSTSARTVFRLAYGNPPLAHVDIAREAGLSLQRVRQILCEVRKELRVALEMDGTEGVARG
jgi:DNA-directed RNA polymerase specialized sigma24 family protein